MAACEIGNWPVQLHPLTAPERERKPGRFLAELLDGRIKPQVVAAKAGSPVEVAQHVVTGGFPEAVARSGARARAWHREYLRSLVERDVQDVARVRDAGAVGRLLEMLALRTAELLNISSLGNDLDLRRETVESYIGVCERLFLVRRLLPWHRNDAKRLVKTPKVYLVDSGLASTLTGLTAQDWNARRDRFGAMLESFVVQQLIAQAGWTDPDLRPRRRTGRASGGWPTNAGATIAAACCSTRAKASSRWTRRETSPRLLRGCGTDRPRSVEA